MDWLMCSSQIHEDTNSVLKDFFLSCHPLTLQAVSRHLIRELCLSKDTFPQTKWSNTFNIFILRWSPLHLCATRRESLSTVSRFQITFVPSLCVIISVRLYVRALTSSLKLSAYFHLQLKNVGSAFEAHEWISSRVTAAPCFPTVMHLGTVTLLSNLVGALLRPETPESGKTLSDSLLCN